MPALSLPSMLTTLATRNATDTNTVGNPLQVVCAWPLSGQYGACLRFLYYFFIAVCIYARKGGWLENALIVPAISAIHGICLAALHKDAAVDMDIYGAFHLCSIGLLIAPLSVKPCRKFTKASDLKISFVWNALNVSGMLALLVEFYRIKTSNCAYDNWGNPISSEVGKFPYGATCNLTCSIDQGPFSPMRGGSANNIYVIPAPNILNSGIACLLAVTCCISTIPRFSLSREAVTVFTVTALAVIIIGERNFFSPQVLYQTEPPATFGQWGPNVGTVLVVIASLYLYLLEPEVEEETEKTKGNSFVHHRNGSTTSIAALQSYPSLQSPYCPLSVPRRPRSSSCPAPLIPIEPQLQNTLSSLIARSREEKLRQWNMLNVQSLEDQNSLRDNESASSIGIVPGGHISSTIVVSSESDTSSSAHTPVCDPHATTRPSEL